MFQAVNILSEDMQVQEQEMKDGGRCGSKIQECWEFEHPRRDVMFSERGGIPLTNSHNVRSARLRFWIPHAGVLQ